MSVLDRVTRHEVHSRLLFRNIRNSVVSDKSSTDRATLSNISIMGLTLANLQLCIVLRGPRIWSQDHFETYDQRVVDHVFRLFLLVLS